MGTWTREDRLKSVRLGNSATRTGYLPVRSVSRLESICKYNGSCDNPRRAGRVRRCRSPMLSSRYARLATVSGFGMNCDTTYDLRTIGVSGIDFCSRLVSERLAELVGEPYSQAIGKSALR